MKKSTDRLIILLLTLAVLGLASLGVFLALRSRDESSSHQKLSRMADEVSQQIRDIEEAESITEEEIVIFPQAVEEAEQATDGTDVQDLIVDLSAQQETEEMQTDVLIQESGTAVSEENETAVSEGNDAPIPRSHQVIFVGDSRTVGMGKAEAHQDDRCTYVGESGEGYRWFIEDGIDLMDQAIRKHPRSPVVFNLGVNDCDHIEAYIEVYHEIEKGYPDTSFYYMSVNPVTEESPHVPLEDILEFNRQLKAAFPEQYIDTCSWMLDDGFEDVDGIHYSEEQYCAIHDFAVRAVSASSGR